MTTHRAFHRRKLAPAPPPEWTEARAREELPEILLNTGKRVVTGKVFGRKNPYATVYVRGEPAIRVNASWGVIVHCLNTGRPLIA